MRSDGRVRDTGIGGTVPGPADDLLVDFSDDGDSAVVVDTSGSRCPDPDRPVSEGRTAVAPRRPDRPPSRASGPCRPVPRCCGHDGVVTLTDRSGTPVQQLEAHQDVVRDVVVAPDGTWAATGDNGAAGHLWDIDPATGLWSEREALTGHDGEVVDMAVDAAGRRLLTLSRDHTLITWDMSADGGFGEAYPALEERWISNRPQLIESEGLLVAPTRSGTNVWPAEPARPGHAERRRDISRPRAPATRWTEVVVGDTIEHAQLGSSVAVSPDGSMVAVTWGRGTTILDTGTRAVIETIVLPPGGIIAEDDGQQSASVVSCAAWTPDGAHLLLVRGRATWSRWTRPPGSVDGALVGIVAQSIEASHDGRRFAVGQPRMPRSSSWMPPTSTWNGGSPLARSDLVLDLSFSPDGRLLAGAAARSSCTSSTPRPGNRRGRPARVHDGWALQTEWMDDGRTIATSGADGTVALFDVERGLVRALPLPASGEPGTGFAHLVPGPDDELVVLSGDRSGRRYPMRPSAWLEQACAIVGRDLTQAEWDRYLPGRDLPAHVQRPVTGHGKQTG